MIKHLHKAHSRGSADHGWLKSAHTFSFAGYYNPERIHFGALRVLNDDRVAPGRGFGAHPHDNMEIISIPISGMLTHKDSMGNEGIISSGEIQVMSAGTGIEHSEMNGSTKEEVAFLQIWVFPNQKNVTPRYDQVRLDEVSLKNKLVPIVGSATQPAMTWIHQDVVFSMGNLDPGTKIKYTLSRKTNGVYVFILEGEIAVEDEQLARRDGLAIRETDSVSMEAITNARVLLMEVPV